MKIGQKVKNLRKQQKHTLKALGAKTNLSPTFLCDIEKGRTQPSLPRLVAIASALNTSVAYLVGEDSNSATIHPDHLNTLHTLSSTDDGQKILQALSCFDSWAELDRQELLQYLTAKETVRNIGR